MLHKSMILTLSIFLCVSLFAENPSEKVLYLNGNKQFFEIPARTYLNVNGNNDLTIEFWFKMLSNDQFYLINKWEFFRYEEWGYRGYGWFINLNQSISNYVRFQNPMKGITKTGWQLQSYVTLLKGGGTHGTGGGGITDMHAGIWYHFAIIFKKDGYVEVYFNEMRKGKDDYMEDDKIDLICPINKPLYIGGHQDSVAMSLYFNGLIDEVRIWNTARSIEQILSTMNDTLSSDYYLTPDSGLVTYYRIDELENLGIGEDGLTDDIQDLTYNANHGDLIGDAVIIDPKVLADIESDVNEVPVSFELLQNYPNPFNPVDILGQEIETLVEERQQSGVYKVTWDAGDLPSGLYICHLKTEGFVKTLKMLLQK
jgi:hypothetical protein